MNASIWSWGITDDLDTLFSRLVAASESDFEAVAQSAIEAAPPANEPDLQEIIGRSEEMIKSATMPATMKAGLLQGLRNVLKGAGEDLEEDEDDVNYEDEGFGECMPSRREIPLATSHMFFEDPYASMDYEEIDAQVNVRLKAYKGAISSALGSSGTSFLDFAGISEDVFESGEDLGDLEEILWHGFVWVWPTPKAVFFLADAQEDKELPRHLSFGRAHPDAFSGLRATMR